MNYTVRQKRHSSTGDFRKRVSRLTLVWKVMSLLQLSDLNFFLITSISLTSYVFLLTTKSLRIRDSFYFVIRVTTGRFLIPKQLFLILLRSVIPPVVCQRPC